MPASRFPGARRAARERGVVRLRSDPAATMRILLLDDRPAGLPSEVDADLPAQLKRLAVGANLDAIRRPGSALRVIAEDARALDRYDAVIAITSGSTRWTRSATALDRAAGAIAERLPTLLVQVEPLEQRRPSLAEDRVQHGAVDVPASLVLPSGIPSQDAARRIGLALRDLLDSGAEPSGRRRADGAGDDVVSQRLSWITRLARDAFALRGSAVNLVHGDDVTTVAAAGVDLLSYPRSDTLCGIAMARPGMTVMPDTWLDPEACRISPTTGADPIRFYAAVPLHDVRGALVGTLCIYDSVPHRAADLDFGLLHDLALLTEGELIDAR